MHIDPKPNPVLQTHKAQFLPNLHLILVYTQSPSPILVYTQNVLKVVKNFCRFQRSISYYFYCYIYVTYALFCIFCFHRAKWHSSAILTEGFPCFFLSCKANARVKLANTGHGPHSSQINCVVLCIVCV